jgi:MFS family permease
MKSQDRQAWLIVAGLFVTLLLVFGSGYNTAGVFVPPLLKEFGWSRAQVSTLQGILALAAGLSVVPIGWLLDRIEARIVMTAGIVMCGLAFISASRVHSFGPMLASYFLLGVGIAAATLLPVSLVIANWFGARRGIAMGVAMAGTSTGGAVMTLVANRAIAIDGWRLGYLALAVPMFLIAIPVVILLVRTRPPEAGGKLSVAASGDRLPGLEVAQALRGRSFWMIALAQFCFAMAAAGAGLHLITYLIGIGYSASRAAQVLSMIFILTAVGKPIFGFFADRVSGRLALAVSLTVAACGMLLLLGAESTVGAVAFVLVYGSAFGAPLVLVPVLMVESLGLKRFGSLSGLAGLANTAGATIGPILAGRIFDTTGSYSSAFELFAAILVVGGIGTLGCVPYDAVQGDREALAVSSA